MRYRPEGGGLIAQRVSQLSNERSIAKTAARSARACWMQSTILCEYLRCARCLYALSAISISQYFNDEIAP